MIKSQSKSNSKLKCTNFSLNLSMPMLKINGKQYKQGHQMGSSKQKDREGQKQNKEDPKGQRIPEKKVLNKNEGGMDDLIENRNTECEMNINSSNQKESPIKQIKMNRMQRNSKQKQATHPKKYIYDTPQINKNVQKQQQSNSTQGRQKLEQQSTRRALTPPAKIVAINRNNAKKPSKSKTFQLSSFIAKAKDLMVLSSVKSPIKQESQHLEHSQYIPNNKQSQVMVDRKQLNTKSVSRSKLSQKSGSSQNCQENIDKIINMHQQKGDLNLYNYLKYIRKDSISLAEDCRENCNNRKEKQTEYKMQKEHINRMHQEISELLKVVNRNNLNDPAESVSEFDRHLLDEMHGQVQIDESTIKYNQNLSQTMILNLGSPNSIPFSRPSFNFNQDNVQTNLSQQKGRNVNRGLKVKSSRSARLLNYTQKQQKNTDNIQEYKNDKRYQYVYDSSKSNDQSVSMQNLVAKQNSNKADNEIMMDISNKYALKLKQIVKNQPNGDTNKLVIRSEHKDKGASKYTTPKKPTALGTPLSLSAKTPTNFQINTINKYTPQKYSYKVEYSRIDEHEQQQEQINSQQQQDISYDMAHLREVQILKNNQHIRPVESIQLASFPSLIGAKNKKQHNNNIGFHNKENGIYEDYRLSQNSKEYIGIINQQIVKIRQRIHNSQQVTKSMENKYLQNGRNNNKHNMDLTLDLTSNKNLFKLAQNCVNTDRPLKSACLNKTSNMNDEQYANMAQLQIEDDSWNMLSNKIRKFNMNQGGLTNKGYIINSHSQVKKFPSTNEDMRSKVCMGVGLKNSNSRQIIQSINKAKGDSKTNECINKNKNYNSNQYNIFVRKLAKVLDQQIAKDMQLRQLRQIFMNYSDQKDTNQYGCHHGQRHSLDSRKNLTNIRKTHNTLDKWKILSHKLYMHGYSYSQAQIQQLLKISSGETNPFSSAHQMAEVSLEQLCSKMAFLFIESQLHWQNSIKGCIYSEVAQLESKNPGLECTFFQAQTMDLNKKGYLSIQDIVCFVNLFAGKFYRNRDAVMLFKRFCMAATQAEYSSKQAPICSSDVKESGLQYYVFQNVIYGK